MPNGKPTKRARRRRKAKKLNNLQSITRIKFRDKLLKQKIIYHSNEQVQNVDLILCETGKKKEFDRNYSNEEQANMPVAIINQDKTFEDVILFERRLSSDQLKEKHFMECENSSTKNEKLDNEMGENNCSAKKNNFHGCTNINVLTDEIMSSKEKVNFLSPCENGCTWVGENEGGPGVVVGNSADMAIISEEKVSPCTLNGLSMVSKHHERQNHDCFVPEAPVLKMESCEHNKGDVDSALESHSGECSKELLNNQSTEVVSHKKNNALVAPKISPLLLKENKTLDTPQCKLSNDLQNNESVRGVVSSQVQMYSSHCFRHDSIVENDGVEVFSNLSNCDINTGENKNDFNVHQILLKTGNINWPFMLVLSFILELIKWLADQSLISLRRLRALLGVEPLEAGAQHCICCLQHKDGKVLQRLEFVERELEELKKVMLRDTNESTVKNVEIKVQCSVPPPPPPLPPPPPPPPPPMPVFCISTSAVLKKAKNDKQKNDTSVRPSITVEDLRRVQLRKTPAASKMDHGLSTPKGPVVSLEMLRSVKLKSCIQRRKSWDRKKAGRDENGLRMKSPTQSPRENPFTWVLRKKESHARLRGISSLATRVGNHFKEAISNEI